MAKCFKCGKEGFKLEVSHLWKNGRGVDEYRLFDPISETYHIKNDPDCKAELERIKQKKKQEEIKKYQAREYRAKADVRLERYKYLEPKRGDDFVKKLCSCNDEQILPIHTIRPIYYFGGVDLIDVKRFYFCGLCGSELSQIQVNKWFDGATLALE